MFERFQTRFGTTAITVVIVSAACTGTAGEMLTHVGDVISLVQSAPTAPLLGTLPLAFARAHAPVRRVAIEAQARPQDVRTHDWQLTYRARALHRA